MAGEEFAAGLAAAAARFNAGEFFEAHEAFEELLDLAEDDGRWELVLGLEKLAPFPATAFGVAIAPLRARAAADRARLEGGATLGPGLAEEPPRIDLVEPRGSHSGHG